MPLMGTAAKLAAKPLSARKLQPFHTLTLANLTVNTHMSFHCAPFLGKRPNRSTYLGIRPRTHNNSCKATQRRQALALPVGELHLASRKCFLPAKASHLLVSCLRAVQMWANRKKRSGSTPLPSSLCRVFTC